MPWAQSRKEETNPKCLPSLWPSLAEMLLTGDGISTYSVSLRLSPEVCLPPKLFKVLSVTTGFDEKFPGHRAENNLFAWNRYSGWFHSAASGSRAGRGRSRSLPLPSTPPRVSATHCISPRSPSQSEGFWHTQLHAAPQRSSPLHSLFSFWFLTLVLLSIDSQYWADTSMEFSIEKPRSRFWLVAINGATFYTFTNLFKSVRYKTDELWEVCNIFLHVYHSIFIWAKFNLPFYCAVIHPHQILPRLLNADLHFYYPR